MSVFKRQAIGFTHVQNRAQKCILRDVFLSEALKWVREVTTLSLRIHMFDTRLFVMRVWIKYMSVATDQFSLEIRHEKSCYVMFLKFIVHAPVKSLNYSFSVLNNNKIKQNRSD